MNKIATHNSSTGEKGKGFLSFLVTPFAKTQSKTIKEQYDAGCRSIVRGNDSVNLLILT